MFVPTFPKKTRVGVSLTHSLHPRTTIATGPHSMSPDIDLEVGQVLQATPHDRAFFSLSHRFPFG